MNLSLNLQQEKQEKHDLGHLSLARDLRGVGVSQYLVFCVVFCRSMFVLLSSCSLSLFCLSVNLRFLITLLVSSNQSSLIVFFSV